MSTPDTRQVAAAGGARTSTVAGGTAAVPRFPGRSEAELIRAEAEVAAAEEDSERATTRFWDVRYRVTHTEDGRERSLSDEGARELTEAERGWLRARGRYDRARGHLDDLMQQRYEIDKPIDRPGPVTGGLTTIMMACPASTAAAATGSARRLAASPADLPGTGLAGPRGSG